MIVSMILARTSKANLRRNFFMVRLLVVRVSGGFLSHFLYQEGVRMLDSGACGELQNECGRMQLCLDSDALSSVFPYSIYKKIELPGWSMAMGKTDEEEPTKISFFVGWLSVVPTPPGPPRVTKRQRTHQLSFFRTFEPAFSPPPSALDRASRQSRNCVS